MLTNHIDKEDNVLFNMGDSVMTEDDQGSLCSQFCEVGCRSFGGKKREELEQMAAALPQLNSSPLSKASRPGEGLALHIRSYPASHPVP